MNSLSAMEASLLNFMTNAGYYNDVAIRDIYAFLYPQGDAKTHRQRQQYVGSVVSKINRKLARYKITPGELKRTYRIVSK